MSFAVGQRIELDAPMRDEPDPVPVGTRGTVTHVNATSLGFTQVSVEWDDGRRLMLCVPPDSARVLTPSGEDARLTA